MARSYALVCFISMTRFNYCGLLGDHGAFTHWATYLQRHAGDNGLLLPSARYTSLDFLYHTGTLNPAGLLSFRGTLIHFGMLLLLWHAFVLAGCYGSLARWAKDGLF